MVHVSGIVSHLKFTFPNHFPINVILSQVISLFMLIFCTDFCLGISAEDALLVQYVSCTMCIFVRNTGKHDMCSGQKIRYIVMLHFQIILFIQPVWCMDFNCSIDILFLYITFHRQLDTDIDDIVYCIFLDISVILNFNFHSLYMLSLSYRYGS